MTRVIGAVITSVTVAACNGPSSPSDARDASCPPGSAPGAVGCACRSDLVLVLGACVSPRAAGPFCGPRAMPAPAGEGSCVPRAPCEAGRARDLGTGECLVRRDVRAIATSIGMLVNEDEELECPNGGELAFASADARGGSPRLACLGKRAAERSSLRCPAGAIAGDRGCVRVAERGRVDVVAWLQAVAGTEGGAGAPPLCASLVQRPGVLAGFPPREARLGVTLSFPDNDVSQVTAAVAVIAPSGATDTLATAELEAAFAPLVESLRSLGTVASQASVATVVRCGPGSADADVTSPRAALKNENDARR